MAFRPDKSKGKTFIKNGLVIEVNDMKNATTVKISRPESNSKRTYRIDHARRMSASQFDNLIKTVDNAGGNHETLFSILEGMGFQKETW